MRMTFSLPEALAKRFLVCVPFRERSVTIARLMEHEIAAREERLEKACLQANADESLQRDVEEWQSFDDPEVYGES